MHKEKIEILGATIDFFKYKENGLTYYEFNATQCSAPEPMVNAMSGLRMLQSKDDRLVGIFFHEPIPLYNRLGDHFIHEAIALENGDFKIIFQRAT